MKNNIDINELARATHSPQGKNRANEENYQSLIGRLEEQPKKSAAISSRRTLWHRVAVAASVVIMSCISYAMIKTYIIDTPQHKTLTYHEAPMSVIIHDIENEYHVRILVKDQSKLNYRITAEFTTDEDVESIIKALSTASGTKVTIDQN